jgi:hypothetical protein
MCSQANSGIHLIRSFLFAERIICFYIPMLYGLLHSALRPRSHNHCRVVSALGRNWRTVRTETDFALKGEPPSEFRASGQVLDRSKFFSFKAEGLVSYYLVDRSDLGLHSAETQCDLHSGIRRRCVSKFLGSELSRSAFSDSAWPSSTSAVNNSRMMSRLLPCRGRVD